MDFQIVLDDRAHHVRKVNLDRDHTLLTAGAGSYLLDGTVISDGSDVHVLIGRYTTLGRRVTFDMDMRQMSEHCTTTYAFDDVMPIGDLSEYACRAGKKQIIIGSDVWIGNDVTILGGVHIGSGAVIRPGSIVTENVPPYAVVEGNPLRIVRYRFDEATIARLRRIRWWHWPEEKIRNNMPLLQGDAALFAEKFDVPEEAAGSGANEIVQTLEALQQRGYRIYYFVPDMTSPEAIWRKVFREYLTAYSAKDKVALLLDIPPEGDIDPCIEELSSLLTARGDDAPTVLTHVYAAHESGELLRRSDDLVTTKEDVSSACAEAAADAGVNILYGLDWAERLFPTSKTYDVTVGVLTYHPDYDKLFITLTSIIRQKGCTIEIIIGDDGTEEFRKEEVEQWLLERGFLDFRIICSQQNQGTVHNALNVLTAAHGDYVKLISPGDYLYSDTVLTDMLSFMKEEGYRVAFGRACYYHKGDEVYQILDLMKPVDLEPYEKKDFSAIKKACLLYSDYILGAVFVGERRLVTAYTRGIADTIIYGEDCVYIMMIADDIEIGFWNQNFIWYEYGTGISTGLSEEWRERLSVGLGACFDMIERKNQELRAARKHFLADHPGKTFCDIQMEHEADIMKKHARERYSYLKNVDPRQLEKLVHGKAIFLS